jgi:hypothetical protein
VPGRRAEQQRVDPETVLPLGHAHREVPVTAVVQCGELRAPSCPR